MPPDQQWAPAAVIRIYLDATTPGNWFVRVSTLDDSETPITQSRPLHSVDEVVVVVRDWMTSVLPLP